MENYVLYDEIGKGEHTIVYKGRRKGTINFVAIYCIDKCLRPEITNRVRLTHELSHENIVKFHEWYETSNHLWMVVELCTGGNLKLMIDQDICLPETSIRRFGRDIIQGLNYLHSMGILFCNLTSSKILLDGPGNLKLSDMSLSKVENENLMEIFQQTIRDFASENTEISKESLSPDPKYCAPEVLNGEEPTYLSDLWSLGCILFEMFSGETPFASGVDGNIIEQILHSNPSSLGPKGDHKQLKPSSDFADLIHRLLMKNPSHRLDWAGLLQHPFWKGDLSDQSEGVTFDESTRPLTLVVGESHSPTSNTLMDVEKASNTLSFSATTDFDSHRPPTALDKADDPKAANFVLSSSQIRSHTLKTFANETNFNQTKQRGADTPTQEWKQLIYTHIDSVVIGITDNAKIAKLTPCRFESKTLPSPPLTNGDCANQSLESLTQHLQPFCDLLKSAEKSGMVYKPKLNVASYLSSICTESKVASILVNKFRLANTLATHVKTNSSLEMRTKYCRLMGLIFFNAATLDASCNMMEIATILTEVIRENFRNAKAKQPILFALGDFLHLLSSQETQTSESVECWTVPSMTYTMVIRSLREGEEALTQHYAAKTIENVASYESSYSQKFSTSEVALLLWHVFSHATSDSLKLTAISALIRINRQNPSLFPSVIDKVGLSNVLDILSVNSKVQTAVLTLFLSMLANGYHLSRLTQDKDFVQRIIRLLESTSALVRSKSYLVLLVVTKHNTEMLLHSCQNKLIIYIERDSRKNGTLKDENQNSWNHLSQCLDYLISSIVEGVPFLINEILATFENVNGRKHPSTIQIKQIRSTLPLFPIVLFLTTSHVFRPRMLDDSFIESLGKLLQYLRSVDSGETCIDSTGVFLSCDEFTSTTMSVLEAISQHPLLICCHAKQCVNFIMPQLALLVVESENGDLRLQCLRVYSDLCGHIMNPQVLSNPEIDPEIIREARHAFVEDFATFMLPQYEQVLIYQDPMPVYGIKVLKTILEYQPSVVKMMENSGLIMVIFQIIVENQDNLGGMVILSLVEIIRIITGIKEVNMDYLYSQGLTESITSLIQCTAEIVLDPNQESSKFTAILPLITSLLDTIQNTLKFLSHVVRQALQTKAAGKEVDTGKAESYLQRNRPFTDLFSIFIQMLMLDDNDIQLSLCNILFVLIQLYAGTRDDYFSTANITVLEHSLSTFDVKKQRLLLRFIKRILTSDPSQIENVRNSASNFKTLLESMSQNTLNTDVSVSSLAQEILRLIK